MVLAKDRTTQQELKARLILIKQIIGFTQKILLKHGVILSQSKSSWDTRIVRRLANFSNFTFFLDSRYAVVPENSIRVWYHPQEGYRKGMRPVFYLRWETEVLKGELKIFEREDLCWETAIKHLFNSIV